MLHGLLGHGLGDRPVSEICFETAHPDWLLITQKLLDVALCYGPVALGVDRNRNPLRWAIAVLPETYDLQALAADIEEDGGFCQGIRSTVLKLALT